MIEFTRGNLLEADVEALVNTVNTVGVMGKGIALQFKKAFPENFVEYKRACDAEQVELGRMFVHEIVQPRIDGPRYIVNFPTKRHWKGRSRLADVEAGLEALVREVRERGIGSIAVPPLGCGLGGLEWRDVRQRIEAAFATLPDVRVLLYEPAGAPAPREMTDRTARPAMTPGRAAVLGLMNRYQVPGYGYTLSLLEVQKLAYFLQEAGEPLKLEYVKHLYGPYADVLRHVLGRIEGHFIVGYGDGKNAPDTPIELLEAAAEEAEAYLGGQDETRRRLERVARLIEGFETPFGMELLSSVHWVATREDPGAKSDPGIAAEGVRGWNERKRRLFEPRHVKVAWDRLRTEGWL